MALRSNRVTVVSGIGFEVISGGDGLQELYLHAEVGAGRHRHLAR